MKLIAVVAVICSVQAALSEPEAKLEEVKPFEAEQNFRLLRKTMETEAKAQPVEADDNDDNTLGSGDWMDDYKEEDYDYDDDEGSGSSKNQLFGTEILHKKSEDKAKLRPDETTTEDFHFEDKKKEDPYKDILYEYYSEILYGDKDEEDELDYTNKIEQVKMEDEDVVVNNSNNSLDLASPSYIFLMLASAFISFAVFTVAFFLCRKSIRKNKEKKAALAPFTVGGVSSILRASNSTPIVKDYQRVPTSTMELMSNSSQIIQQQQQEKAEMGLSETQRPLLT